MKKDKKEIILNKYKKSRESYFEIWKKMMELKERQERIHLCGM